MNAYHFVYAILVLIMAALVFVAGSPWTSGSLKRYWRKQR